jgi:membrane protease YdiL (CAAX protease family)
MYTNFLAYLATVRSHPITRFIDRGLNEAVKVAGASVFLKITSEYLFHSNSKLNAWKIYRLTTFSPTVEELYFRGIILPTVCLFQYGILKLAFKYEIISEETKNKITRGQRIPIHLTALFFAYLHHILVPTRQSWDEQFIWSYTGGVIYGSLAEKYQTLSLSILAHGMNNFVVAGMLYKSPMLSNYLNVQSIDKIRMFVRLALIYGAPH